MSEPSSSTQVASIEQNRIRIFKSIKNFVSQLHENFPGSKQFSLYARLLHRLTENDSADLLDKQISVFERFYLTNKDSLNNRNTKFMETVERIEYNDNIFIPIGAIWKKADSESRNIIFEHLTTISTLIDPTATRTSIIPGITGNGKEERFLNDLVGDLTSKCGDEPDIGSIMTGLLTGGGLAKIRSKAESGNLDPVKLLGLVEGIVSNLKSKMGDISNKEE